MTERIEGYLLPLFFFTKMKKKHAFLIMAHTCPEQLSLLLELLDQPWADLYLHLDRRAPFSPEDLGYQAKYARLISLPRKRVSWGGRSQIDCELSLMEASLAGEYAYYHLISGQDLPLVPMDRFYAFFEEHRGKEWIHFDSDCLPASAKSRLSYYWLFQEKERCGGLWYRANHTLVSLQERIGVDRTKKRNKAYYKGANWFSCSHAFLSFVIAQKKEIRKEYAFTRCCDEIFLQTLLMHSPFRDQLFDQSFSDSTLSNMRFVDWERGCPYTFRREDVPTLLSSGHLFGRKFDLNRDPEAVCEIYHSLKEG